MTMRIIKNFFIVVFFLTWFAMFFVQYIGYTPHYDNEITHNTLTGMLNGFFLVINMFLYLGHYIGTVDNSYYFIDLQNYNEDYLLGFCIGVLNSLTFIAIDKSTDEKKEKPKPQREVSKIIIPNS